MPCRLRDVAAIGIVGIAARRSGDAPSAEGAPASALRVEAPGGGRAPGRVVTSRTGASSGGTTFGPPDAGAPDPVRRTPMGSARSSAVGVSAGMRGAVATAALAAGAGGISSRRGSEVAAVGLSFTSFDSSSAFLPLAEKRWIVKAATATREPISRARPADPSSTSRCAAGPRRWGCRARRAAARSCCRLPLVRRPRWAHVARSRGSCVMVCSLRLARLLAGIGLEDALHARHRGAVAGRPPVEIEGLVPEADDGRAGAQHQRRLTRSTTSRSSSMRALTSVSLPSPSTWNTAGTSRLPGKRR
jgi:hypothetical protein